MLKRNQRLKSKDIPHLARKGKRLVGEGFEVRVWWDDKIKPSFSISISTALDKKAVVRNKVKRRFKVAILALQKRENFKYKNGKYLFIVRSLSVLDLTLDQLSEAILKSLAH